MSSMTRLSQAIALLFATILLMQSMMVVSLQPDHTTRGRALATTVDEADYQWQADTEQKTTFWSFLLEHLQASEEVEEVDAEDTTKDIGQDFNPRSILVERCKDPRTSDGLHGVYEVCQQEIYGSRQWLQYQQIKVDCA